MTMLQTFMTDLLVGKTDVVIVSDAAKVPLRNYSAFQKSIDRMNLYQSGQPQNEMENTKKNQRWGKSKDVGESKDKPFSSSVVNKMTAPPSSPTRSFGVVPLSFKRIKSSKQKTKENSQKTVFIPQPRTRTIRFSPHVQVASGKHTHVKIVQDRHRTITRPVVPEVKPSDIEQLKAESIISMVQALSLKAAMTITQKQNAISPQSASTTSSSTNIAAVFDRSGGGRRDRPAVVQ